jgi:nicotinamide riboside kinase
MESHISKTASYPRIAVIGPESSGKTTLSIALSRKLQLPLVGEFARDYFSTRDYLECNLSDLVEIAKKQYAQAHQKPFHPLISDTEMITLLIWARDKYKFIPNEIKMLSDIQFFDLYLLCYPDMPWELDPLRTDAHRRIEIFELYQQNLIQNRKAFIVLKGSLDTRIQQVINFLA